VGAGTIGGSDQRNAVVATSAIRVRRTSTVLRFVFVMAVAVWLGTVVSFSFRLFPRYYGACIVCGFIALASVSLARSSGLPTGEALRLAVPVAGGLLCSLLSQYVLLPRLRALPSSDDERYLRLHTISSMLNSTLLALLLLAVAGAVMR